MKNSDKKKNLVVMTLDECKEQFKKTYDKNKELFQKDVMEAIKHLAMSDEELDTLKTRVLNEDTTSFGLTSAYKRLKLLYGDEFTFNIESKPQEGTSISFKIPGKADIDNETIL